MGSSNFLFLAYNNRASQCKIFTGFKCFKLLHSDTSLAPLFLSVNYLPQLFLLFLLPSFFPYVRVAPQNCNNFIPKLYKNNIPGYEMQLVLLNQQIKNLKANSSLVFTECVDTFEHVNLKTSI